ncbi:MAG: DUF6516 family protein [Gammaproteobacteria bacterium]|nr:DUF6516 family protein [Gammaproteobacteria bacterium]
MIKDRTIENLLELNDIRYVIDERLGLWVKFEAEKTASDKNRPYGLRYSLTLHDRHNRRIMGFDNSHAVEYGGKKGVAPRRVYDHWHRDESDEGRPYHYVNAGKLIEDFWHQVSKILKQLDEG